MQQNLLETSFYHETGHKKDVVAGCHYHACANITLSNQCSFVVTWSMQLIAKYSQFDYDIPFTKLHKILHHHENVLSENSHFTL